jgi:hypothetical protein
MTKEPAIASPVKLSTSRICLRGCFLGRVFLPTLIAVAGANLFTPHPTFAQQAEVAAQPEATQSANDAATPPTKTKLNHDRFLRIRKDERDRSMALETSIVRYEKVTKDNTRITVDLIGAVHVGHAEYYKQLNKQFEKYEVLLYELVAPEGTVIPKGGRDPGESGVPTSPVAALQMGMKSVLELDFQLELIDYTKDNFVHADMSPEEYGESMEENDESLTGYALKGIGQGMALQAAGKGGGEIGMLMALFSKNKAVRLRRSMAKQMVDMGAGMIMFEGKNGSTIIDHRNAKCMSVLKEQIDSGKRNLAIFYGAGHLADMEQRLLNEFGMKRGGTRWLTAWKLR